MRMLPKLVVGSVALLCISYSTFCSTARAATPEDITSLMSAFSTMKFRVISTRKIIFWDAQANLTAYCYKFFVPDSVVTPPKGQGFYANQWSMYRTSSIVTEEQCYAQP